MEHPCYRCGAAVEDGVAFCPQCNAPQIRVAIAEPEAPPPPLTAGSADQLQAATDPALTPAGEPGKIDWSLVAPGAALAGALVAIAWMIPFAPFFLWMLAGGALTVALYKKRQPSAVLTRGAGARIGAAGGAFGFGLFALFMAVQLLAVRNNGQLREQLQQALQQAAGKNLDPQSQEMLQKVMTPEGLALMITLMFVFLLLAFLALSAVGGALGAWLFGGKRKKSR